jgi:hypothetical protein
MRRTASILTLAMLTGTALAGAAHAQDYSIIGGEIALASGDASGPSLSIRGTVRILPAGDSSGPNLTVTDASLLQASPCPADLTGNGAVDAADLAALLSDWSQPGAGDLDGDGSVGPSDLAQLVGAWGLCF